MSQHLGSLMIPRVKPGGSNDTVVLADMKLSLRFYTVKEAIAIIDNLNKFNRGIKPQSIRRMSNDMRTKKWVTHTAEFVKFDIQGNLIDGQNRFLALIDSGEGQWLLVAEGLATEVREVIDQGVRRNGADSLHFHKVPNCTRGILASTLRAIGAWEAGWLINAGQDSSRYNISNSDIVQLYDEHQDAVESVNWSGSVPDYMKIVPRSVLAFTYHVTTHIDPSAAKEFWDGLVNQQTTGAGDPRLAMMDLFHRSNGRETRRKGRANGMFVYGIFETWNQWRDGNRVARLLSPTIRTKKDDPIRYRDIPLPQ